MQAKQQIRIMDRFIKVNSTKITVANYTQVLNLQALWIWFVRNHS